MGKVSDVLKSHNCAHGASWFHFGLLGACPRPGTPAVSFPRGSGIYWMITWLLLSLIPPPKCFQRAVFCRGCLCQPLVSLSCSFRACLWAGRSLSAACPVASDPWISRSDPKMRIC